METDPYQISTVQQLRNLDKCVLESYQDNYYILNNDIDLTSYLQGEGNNDGAGWEPLSKGSGAITSFYGKLNGNGHKVSGLWINRPSEFFVGLFDYLPKQAEIRNIGVEIDNSKGGIKGDNIAGGLVGLNNGTIINSYAIGNITGVTGESGGLVGINSGGIIINSHATGSVTGSNSGGLVAFNQGLISNSYATGNVMGVQSSGGLVGENNLGGTISNCYATGNITGENSVGGLVGFNITGTISNSYATGNVINGSGLVGNNFSGSFISNSYAIGSVINGDGLVGSDDGMVSSSFYDKETSGQTGDYSGVTGKRTAEMKLQSTYEGWDFEGVWEINPSKNNGYPSLLWQNPEHLASITLKIPNQTWIGSAITPKPSITFKGNLLIEGTHFDYSYSDNLQIGMAKLRIVGKGIYLGQAKEVEFEIIPATCGTGFAGGSGTKDNPYKITEAKNLDAIHNCLDRASTENAGKYFELQNNIDLGGYIADISEGWRPVNNVDGKLNGNGHKISGLWINRPLQNNVGLFGIAGHVNGMEIKNIGVEIDNAKGGIRGFENVGGLVGTNTTSDTISSSYVIGNVTGNKYVGGLVGGNGGAISNSYATGNVTVGMGGNVGGLVGSNNGTISNSYATGSATIICMRNCSNRTGGLVGENNSGGTIINSYAVGRATGPYQTNQDFLWLVGSNSGIISSSYYDNEKEYVCEDTCTDRGIGKKTAEMKMQSTYEGWDFVNIWEINPAMNGGYPILQNMENPSVLPIQKNPITKSVAVNIITNAIQLSNLPQNTKVELYNLQGKRIYSTNSGNSKILKIPVQTGVYIVKAGSQTMKVTMR